MLLTIKSIGVSDIPDLVVAALWAVTAVLAVMVCFIARNKRAVVGLALLSLASVLRVVAEFFSEELTAQRLSEVAQIVYGAITAAAAIVLTTSKNRLNRALWLTASIGLLLLQTGILVLLPLCVFAGQVATQNAAEIALKCFTYITPVFTPAMLLALFLNFFAKKQIPADEEKNSPQASADTREQTRDSCDQAVSEVKNDQAESAPDDEPHVESSTAAAEPPSPYAASTAEAPTPKKRLLYCRHCGFRSESIYTSCPRCSNEMTEILVCPNCGTETYGIFCGNCGTKVRK